MEAGGKAQSAASIRYQKTGIGPARTRRAGPEFTVTFWNVHISFAQQSCKLEFGGQMIAQLTVGEATDARAVQAFKKVFFPANSYNLKAFP